MTDFDPAAVNFTKKDEVAIAFLSLMSNQQAGEVVTRIAHSPGFVSTIRAFEVAAWMLRDTLQEHKVLGVEELTAEQEAVLSEALTKRIVAFLKQADNPAIRNAMVRTTTAGRKISLGRWMEGSDAD